MSSNKGPGNPAQAQRGRTGAPAQTSQHQSGSHGNKGSPGPSTRGASQHRVPTGTGAMREASRGPVAAGSPSRRPADGQSPQQRLASPARIVPGQVGAARHGSPGPASSNSPSRSTGQIHQTGTTSGPHNPGTRSNRASPAPSDASQNSGGSDSSGASISSGETFIKQISYQVADGGRSDIPTDFVLCIDGTGNDMVNEDELKNTNIAKITDFLRYGKQADRMVAVAYQQGLGNQGTSRTNNKDIGWFQRLQATFDKMAPTPSLIAKLVAINYTYICTSVRPSKDRLFLFGFSRGAYISQITAALVADLGIFDTQQYLSKHGDEPYPTIIRNIVDTWIKFQGNRNAPGLRTELGPYASCLRVMEIEFLGHFDMVASVGLPDSFFGESQSTKFRFAETVHNRPEILNAYHAVAIHEHRKHFAPVLWKEQPGSMNQRVSQVWFPGYHTSVGGGTKQQGIMINYITLAWMLSKCTGLADVVHRPELTKAITIDASAGKTTKVKVITDSKKGIWAKPGVGDHFRQELGSSAIDMLHQVCDERSWNTYCAPDMPKIVGNSELPTRINRLLQAGLFDTANHSERLFLQDILNATSGGQEGEVSPPRRGGRGHTVILDS